MTQLEYGWGIGTENRTDHLGATFAGNVNRKVGLGAWMDYPYTKGSYAYQAVKVLDGGYPAITPATVMTCRRSTTITTTSTRRTAA